MMRNGILIFIIAAIFLAGSIHAQVTDQEVAQLSERINSAEKVEQLYSIRYAVGRYASRTDLTIAQQKQLMETMKTLAEVFKYRRHYKNASDVYNDYLDYHNNYLVRYNNFAKDSLKAVHKNIAESEIAEIAKLDAQINMLTKSRVAVVGLKQQYYSFGMYGGIAVIVLTLIILFSRNRAITRAEMQISGNREKLKSVNRNITSAGMVKGAVAFCKETASVNVQIIESVIESVTLSEEQKIFQKELVSLQSASTKFKDIAS